MDPEAAPGEAGTGQDGAGEGEQAGLTAGCDVQVACLDELTISEEVVLDEILELLARFQDNIHAAGIQQTLVGTPYTSFMEWLTVDSVDGRSRWRVFDSNKDGSMTSRQLSVAVVSYLRHFSS